MKNRFSTKITTFVIVILLFVIITMVYASYLISENFYKENLRNDVEHRLRSHAIAIEHQFDLPTINHVFLMEQKEDVHLGLFDQNLQLILQSDSLDDEWVDTYREWIKDQLAVEHPFPIIDDVHTGIGFHIPHIWGVHPIVTQGEIQGYLFMDQDTEKFEATKAKLIQLFGIMGIITFIIGFFLLMYLTNKMSRPLREMGRATTEIANGNFENIPKESGSDEVGQLARDIKSMAHQLKEYRDSRQQFISHISHDLRTPITYIKGYSAILKDSADLKEEERIRTVEVIYNEATRMEHLVQDLFQLSKLEEGRIGIQKEKFQALPWLSQLIESRTMQLEKKNVTLKLRSNQEDIVLFADEFHLSKAVVNLVENSIRYCQSGDEIEVAVFKEGKQVCINITDTGIGIPEADIPHIWDRFYRVDKARTSHSGGSGLGLAIVKQIIELHNGTVTVQSQVGVGTTFSLCLPDST
ncbi:sensor histidine kinase [Bacillus alkalicellulosilyticus]|uniref:sensor histidine kinase n=1 Tax=Alkalihalobacterium alkalicellulosilyticum TaxID=1912214 RepID=UPI000997EBD5|nr:sensor histidine kinase [Bacillus alkalicellulosilyticus]